MFSSQITLNVEQLPDLTDGNMYQCVFDDLPPVAASKVGNELTCTTPATANIPSIQSGNGKLMLVMAITSSSGSSQQG